MSIGNTNTQGNKKNNFPYQLASLQLLGEIAASTAVPCCPTAATEATLQQVLTALQQGQAYTQALVTDQGGVGCPANCPTYIEIRIWNGLSFDAPIYYDASGAVVVPFGPVAFINPQYVLENILIQETATATALTSSRTPNILRSILAEGIVPPVYSVSFYNAGTTDATVIGVVLKAGETINFDAGGSGNTFPGSSFSWVADATSELLVIFVY